MSPSEIDHGRRCPIRPSGAQNFSAVASLRLRENVWERVKIYEGGAAKFLKIRHIEAHKLFRIGNGRDREFFLSATNMLSHLKVHSVPDVFNGATTIDLKGVIQTDSKTTILKR